MERRKASGSLIALKPRDKRLMNTLTSVALCAALLIAYYMVAGREPIPPDTRITFDGVDKHVELLADGTILSHTPTGTVRSTAGTTDVRKVLRVFKRARFMDADVARYHGACRLALVSDHRRTAVQDDCVRIQADFAKPLQALSAAANIHLP